MGTDFITWWHGSNLFLEKILLMEGLQFNMLSALFVLRRCAHLHICTLSCYIGFNCTFYIIQLIKEATLPEITSSGLWDHFKFVTVPAIKLWQVVQEVEKAVPTVAEVVVEYAQYCCEFGRNSEVCLWPHTIITFAIDKISCLGSEGGHPKCTLSSTRYP